MNASPYATAAHLTVACGLAGTGKTTWLAERVAADIEAGIPVDQMIVFASTPLACEILRLRLCELVGASDTLTITTVRSFALSMLGTPAARAKGARKPRILMRFEENILMEDMKTSGVQPRRLREMLKFFRRSIADLEPMDHDWFYNDEERKAFELLGKLLRHYEAYLEDEVSRAALQLVSSDPETFGAERRKCIYIDDYQMLSKASQCLAGALATESLVIAADGLARVEAIESFPCFDGIEQLLEANENCTRVSLGQGRQANAVRSAINELVTDPALSREPISACDDAEEGSFELVPFARPDDEFEGVAEMVHAEIAHGTQPERIAIATPNAIWERNVVRALSRKGIPAARVERLAVGCDVRELERCEEARALALIALVADPQDQLAVRCWCGFGDYLANSGLFANLVMRGKAITLDTRLEPTGGDALIAQEAARASEALRCARDIVYGLAGLVGNDLARAAWAQASVTGRPIPSWLDGISQHGESALEIVEAARERSTFPRALRAGVLVGSADCLPGVDVDVVVLSGFVDGFTPSRSYFDPSIVERDKRPALLASEAAKTYCCAGKARRKLVITYFTEAPLTIAESLKLKVFRVRYRDGERVCEIHPSETIRALTGVSFDG